MWSFVLKLMVPTLILEIIFYSFGQFNIDNGKIAFNDFQGYTFISSIGAVVFIAGIFTLSFKGLGKIKNLHLRLFSISYFVEFFMVAYQDYKYLNRYYSDFNNHYGDSARQVSAFNQNIMYQHFLIKFGRENLKKPAILYLDSKGIIFNQSSFTEPIIYRIFYDENTNLIRNNCKVVTSDIKILEKAYTVYNGEKGFLYDTPCVGELGLKPQTVFYPLTSFYAYKIQNKEFIDIKDEILSGF